MITSENDYDNEEEEYYYYDDYGDEDLYDYADYRLMVNIISNALYAVHLFFGFGQVGGVAPKMFWGSIICSFIGRPLRNTPGGRAVSACVNGE